MLLMVFIIGGIVGLVLAIASYASIPKVDCPKCGWSTKVPNKAGICPSCKTRFIVDENLNIKEIL